MAPSTKTKIRNVMSVIFNHAIRYEWLEQARNPVRQSVGLLGLWFEPESIVVQ